MGRNGQLACAFSIQFRHLTSAFCEKMKEFQEPCGAGRLATMRYNSRLTKQWRKMKWEAALR
jgi:hypothetical protein